MRYWDQLACSTSLQPHGSRMLVVTTAHFPCLGLPVLSRRRSALLPPMTKTRIRSWGRPRHHATKGTAVRGGAFNARCPSRSAHANHSHHGILNLGLSFTIAPSIAASRPRRLDRGCGPGGAIRMDGERRA